MPAQARRLASMYESLIIGIHPASTSRPFGEDCRAVVPPARATIRRGYGANLYRAFLVSPTDLPYTDLPASFSQFHPANRHRIRYVRLVGTVTRSRLQGHRYQ